MPDVNVVTCSASSIEGINNFGDELLTDLYGRWIEDVDPSISVSHLRISQLGVLRGSAREELDRASLLVFSGGGYFADGYGESRLHLKRHLRSLRNHRVYWTVAKAARRRGLRHGVFGLEVGPLVNPVYRRAVKRILTTAGEVVVRNAESLTYAERLCGESARATMHLDAALAISGLAGMEVDNRSDGGFNIGCHVHRLGDGARAQLMTLIERVISERPTDSEPRFFYLHDQRKLGEHATESASAERTLRAGFPETTVIQYRDPMETVRQIAEMDVVITSKLHVGIVARAFGIPVLAVGRHPKIRRFYRAIGEEEFCGEPGDFVANGLPSRLSACLKGHERPRLPVAERFRESALQNRAAVARLVSTVVGVGA
jgi:polysaccharide pyruvyl transferase WcaK-like protein